MSVRIYVPVDSAARMKDAQLPVRLDNAMPKLE